MKIGPQLDPISRVTCARCSEGERTHHVQAEVVNQVQQHEVTLTRRCRCLCRVPIQRKASLALVCRPYTTTESPLVRSAPAPWIARRSGNGQHRPPLHTRGCLCQRLLVTVMMCETHNPLLQHSHETILGLFLLSSGTLST
jgi:hypothetical protein